MQNWRLTVCISPDVSAVDCVKHGGAGRKIEWDIICQNAARRTWDGFYHSPLFDVLMGDADVRQLTVGNDMVTPQPAVFDDVGKIANVGDVINLGHPSTFIPSTGSGQALYFDLPRHHGRDQRGAIFLQAFDSSFNFGR